MGMRNYISISKYADIKYRSLIDSVPTLTLYHVDWTGGCLETFWESDHYLAVL